ncbi:methionyl-tRNA formyltransferase [Nemorincola caseinilytica]|uniref:Methionyl-tRNA formyltransferase n=1 Tax=Nemorincola caseinilytica TaxID=2054315 RepID=A0ABP8NRU8_9BACT
MKTFEQLRIVFFGTPDFAVASLRALKDAGANIVAVVTAPDKPAGRGMHMQGSAVKQYAVAEGLPVLQPVSMKAPEFIEQLRALNADLQIVVAFRMMPQAVWDMPPMGTVNVHGSLLPQYRGAAPINHAIMNGDKVSGVTTFRLKHEIDTGNILLQKEVSILPEDNMGTLYEKLMLAGAELLVTTVKRLAAGDITEIPQSDVPESELRHAPKIFKEHTLIDWTRPAKDIHNMIRGLSPYPAAYTMLKDRSVKIFVAEALTEAHNATPGTYDTDHSTYLRFAAADGWIYVKELQQEGKKKMGIVEFLRGFRG